MKKIKLLFLTLLSYITLFAMNTKDALMQTSMNDVENLLSVSGLEHLESYEDESFEDFENWENLEPEYMEHLNKSLSQGKNQAMAQKYANDKMTNRYGNKWVKAKRAGSSGGSSKIRPISGGRLAGSYSATYDIVISRPTININQTLPIVLFAPKYLTSNYTNFFASNPLPAGVTLVITISSVGALVYTFTSGLNVDVITITCNQNPYISFLENLKTASIKLTKNYVRVDTTNALAQFSNAFNTNDRSLYGTAKTNSFTPSAFSTPEQQNEKVIRIPLDFDITGNVAWVVGMSAIVQTYTINSFVQDTTARSY